MNIRIRPVVITQSFSDLPVPVGTETISPAIPNAKYKPGKSSEQHRDQMQFPCFWKCPANNIEQRKYCMKDKEKDIEELVQHAGSRCDVKIK